jgi:hypothetical protein
MLIDTLQIVEGAGTVNLSFPKGTSFPASPNAGEVFYRTDEKLAYVYSGTEWSVFGSGQAGTGDPAQVYDIGFTCPGEVSPSSTLLYFVASRAFTLPSSFDNCAASVGTITTGVVFSLRKNGSEFGTVSFTSGGAATLAASTDTMFDVQDVFSIESPAGVMPTNLALTFAVVLG